LSEEVGLSRTFINEVLLELAKNWILSAFKVVLKDLGVNSLKYAFDTSRRARRHYERTKVEQLLKNMNELFAFVRKQALDIAQQTVDSLSCFSIPLA